MLQNDIQTEKNLPKAKEYFQKAAKLGDAFIYYLPPKIILVEENTAAKDLKTASEYLNTPSVRGNQFAQYATEMIQENKNSLDGSGSYNRAMRSTLCITVHAFF
ncbi:hypothetical protein CLNEO_28260 [Anaerotignum neopropionicum]|uniref:Sel1 repeat protein n=2 Tax=Anaerotignum neopropionicum TaxID=36847 RepID=A0A136WBQ2_9FIRM|nr:hypothetical protein CLNEO_28260 [Anaerotignum neopropionicum]